MIDPIVDEEAQFDPKAMLKDLRTEICDAEILLDAIRHNPTKHSAELQVVARINHLKTQYHVLRTLGQMEIPK